MTLNLFLDANILLSFYALSNSDIEQLKQLNTEVKNKNILLLVSDQLVSEVERNREAKIEDAFKVFRGSAFKSQAPSFIKPLKDFEDLQGHLKKANEAHAKIVGAVNGLIENHELDADNVIAELFKESLVTKIKKKHYKAALKRFHEGRPPGKKKVTLGDELNWEFLLRAVPEGEDLHLVSLDGDFSSPRDSKKVNSALQKEWEKKKKSKLHFYYELNDFFKNHIPNIKLATQAKLDIIIGKLKRSGSYATTHSIIAELPTPPEFTDKQILDLKEIFLKPTLKSVTFAVMQM
ncbi:PIN domain-containing protein [Ruegeria conchae]|uniref:DUF4935 domain-containing protein n=1 Tax=Ruegeria conchae TaxID=981384 RepID=A0A497ZLD0_9RHOB|nr:PIN domain-containing protein [Ruegeria conchae]RLK08432.1 hypothetical protein CLV75_2107 [Ruegeria conchae]